MTVITLKRLGRIIAAACCSMIILAQMATTAFSEELPLPMDSYGSGKSIARLSGASRSTENSVIKRIPLEHDATLKDELGRVVGSYDSSLIAIQGNIGSIVNLKGLNAIPLPRQ